VRFVTEKEIGKLNETYRGKSCPTDVLSFIAEGREDGRTVRREGRTKAGWPRVNESVCELGDIVICASVARKEARRRSIDVKEECVRLLVHGVLHLAWMDHEKKSDEKRMFALQEGIVKKVVGGSVKGVGRVNGGTVSLLNC
jgi:probable rRNA maturation factor